MKQFDDLAQLLIEKSIKPSIQRIKILQYMLSFKGHPTVEQIYHDLISKMHSLSKATIYNTLALFAEKGLVRILTLENNENRYDVLTFDHGHFVCESCGSITDFKINMDHIPVDQLCACHIRQRDVFYKGICQSCLKK